MHNDKISRKQIRESPRKKEIPRLKLRNIHFSQGCWIILESFKYSLLDKKKSQKNVLVVYIII